MRARIRQQTALGGGTPRRGRSGVIAFIVLVGLSLVAAACGADSSAQGEMVDTASDAAFAVEDAADATEEAEVVTTAGESTGADTDAEPAKRAPTASLGSGGAEAQPVQPIVDIGRDIIYTAAVEVAAPDVAAAGNEASLIISSLGGLLFGQTSTTNPTARTTLTFKVRPEDFQTALSQLGGIGDLRNQTISADDVTERVVDLESRISTSVASVTRLQNLLENADDIETIAAIERQLLDRETNLEQLRGQLRTVQDRVDLATITLTITEALSSPAVAVRTTGYQGLDQGNSCPGSTGLSTEVGTDITWCFSIVNVGDTPLTNITISEPALKVDSIASTTVIWGDTSEPLEPGESWLLSTEGVAENTFNSRTRVSAQPIDEQGQQIGAKVSSGNDTIRITVFEPDTPPTFTDALSGSWGLLKRLAQGAVLAVGALIPFVWLIAVLVFAWRWLGKRRTRAQSAAAPMPPAPIERGNADAEERALVGATTHKATATDLPDGSSPPAPE